MPGHKTRGRVELLVGSALCILAVVGRNFTGKISLLAAVIGPMVVVVSIAAMAFPIDKLYYPVDIVEGKPVYDVRSTDLTPLMWGFIATGFLLGAAYAYCIGTGVI
jgi:hypothetical protein